MQDWKDEEVRLVEEAVKPPGKNAPSSPLPPSPHGVLEDQRQDYRKYPLATLKGVTMSDVDFSQARSPRNDYGADRLIQLIFVSCDRVSFDRAGRFHRIDGTFRDCSFRKIRTSGAGLTGTFENCDFSDANLKRAGLGANFRNCCFDGANMLVDCWGASFLNCTFDGAKIDDMFSDIRALVDSGEPVTFSILASGKIHAGVAADM